MVETPSDLTFFQYFSYIMIRRMGWPKKRGWLRRRDVVDDSVLGSVHSLIVQMGFSLGANHPDVAHRLIAEMFPDPSKEGVDRLISSARDIAEEKISTLELSPAWRRLLSMKLPSGECRPLEYHLPGEEFLKWESILRDPAFALFKSFPLQAMAWALAHPSDARQAVAEKESRVERVMELVMEKLAPSLRNVLLQDEGLDRMCVDAVQEYELKVGTLPNYPGASNT